MPDPRPHQGVHGRFVRPRPRVCSQRMTASAAVRKGDRTMGTQASETGSTSAGPLADSFTGLVPHDGIEIREGYADVGDDVRLHYVEAGEGPLVLLLHGFPEFWFGWRLQIAPLAAAGFRVVAP